MTITDPIVSGVGYCRLALMRDPFTAKPGESRLTLTEESGVFANHGGGADVLTFRGRTPKERDQLMSLESWTRPVLPRPLPRFESWKRFEWTVDRAMAVMEELGWDWTAEEHALIEKLCDRLRFECRDLIVS